MDANGQRFWCALGGKPWRPQPPGTLEVGERFLRLASARSPRVVPEDLAAATARLALVPQTRDAFGGRAWYDAGALAVRATSGGLPPTKLLDVPGPVTDLALGYDEYLYLAVQGQVWMHDLLGRWPGETIGPAGFEAWRLAADPGGGAWVLDRTHRQLARLTGQLFPPPPPGDFPPDMFRPRPENPRPFRLELLPTGWLEAGDDPVAIAAWPGVGAAVLVWSADGRGRVLVVDAAGRRGPVATLHEAGRPFSLAWLEDDRFAALAARASAGGPAVSEALVYVFAGGEIHELGEVFPLRNPAEGPFLHGVTLPVEYPVTEAGSRPLVSVSLPSYAPSGVAVLGRPDSEVTGNAADTAVRTLFDSGADGTAWHRVYAEAVLPPGAGFLLEAAALDPRMEGTSS